MDNFLASPSWTHFLLVNFGIIIPFFIGIFIASISESLRGLMILFGVIIGIFAGPFLIFYNSYSVYILLKSGASALNYSGWMLVVAHALFFFFPLLTRYEKNS